MTTRGRLTAERKKAERERQTSKESIPEEHVETELIPTIPNDLALQVISTKLPWSTVLSLSSVSRPWRQAIQSREVFEARVRSNSTETLFVISNALSDGSKGLAVYSLQYETCYQLPPIPHVESGIPESCECITLDGKIFVLGGLKNPYTQLGSRDVFMLDVAGQRQWKKCASMQAPRQSFAYGVINGKIYACGGSSCHAPVLETEVYDPKGDAWTTLSRMPSLRTGHDVAIIEGELVVYNGSVFRHNFRELQHFLRMFSTGLDERSDVDRADHVDVYNPINDQWRSLSKDVGSHLTDTHCKRFFVAEGRLHSLTCERTGYYILAFDPEAHSSTRVYSVRFSAELSGSFWTWPRAILAIDDVLLSVHGEFTTDRRFEDRLIQSRGFGTDCEELVWQKAPISLSFDGLRCPFIRAIEL